MTSDNAPNLKSLLERLDGQLRHLSDTTRTASTRGGFREAKPAQAGHFGSSDQGVSDTYGDPALSPVPAIPDKTIDAAPGMTPSDRDTEQTAQMPARQSEFSSPESNDSKPEESTPAERTKSRGGPMAPVHAQPNRTAQQSRAIAPPDFRVPIPGSGGDGKHIDDHEPNDSIRRPALFGWIIIILFFGGLGGWALFAPLHGAVVANGVIKVEGNRKSVQHLDGGIVKVLSIKEGDRVKAGDLLIALDDSQARAEFQVLLQQFYVLRATDERLKTELARGTELVMPTELRAVQGNDPEVVNIWKGQIQQFESRLTALEGQRSVIRERIAQYEAQIKGSEAQVKAYEIQFRSVQKELESIAPLVERGLIATPRRLQLERSGAQLEGQAADAIAGIAKARQAIVEQRQQIAQLDNERFSEVSKELKETQAKELETLSRLANARAVLSRTEIRAPYSGQVVGLNVFSVGGVIMRGDKILDLVPEQDSLVIEAQVAVEDISDVHPDMRADVHLTAYKQRITPVVQGAVIQVSADRLTDNKTNLPYFTALIKLDEQQLAELPQVKLYPGMPATVMIRTIERTAFDYIVGPLIMSFNKAFRQK